MAMLQRTLLLSSSLPNLHKSDRWLGNTLITLAVSTRHHVCTESSSLCFAPQNLAPTRWLGKLGWVIPITHLLEYPEYPTMVPKWILQAPPEGILGLLLRQ